MTLTQTHDLDASLRTSNAVTDAVAQLTKPRLIHTEIRNDHGGIERLHTEEHKPLIDLLEDIDAMQSGGGRGGASHTRTPFDIEAHELLKEIRQQVRTWLRQLHATTSRDLKGELTLWHTHYDNAVLRGHLSLEEQRAIARKLDGWVNRIEAKYDPTDRLEFTDPCPAIIRNDAGDPRRCAARKVRRDSTSRDDHADWVPAIEIDITRRTARCLACGTRWEEERGLMQLRYEANLAALEADAT
jgi:hypothetical protein